jgi:cytochrome bd-type quinol oxidase subunit 2
MTVVFGVCTVAALAVAGVAWAGGPVVVSLHGLLRSLALRYVLVMVLGSMVAIGWWLHELRDDWDRPSTASPPSRPPNRPRWNRLRSWVLRVAIAPMMALGGLGLVRSGLPVAAAVCLAIVAWTASDLAEVAIYPSRLALSRMGSRGAGARGA